jgi:hypothetical protein
MKRTLIALAAAAGLGLSAGVASADPGGYAPPGPGASIGTFGPVGGPNTLLGAGDLPPGRGPDMYGLHPCIKRFFHIPSGGGGKHGGCGPGGCGPGGYGFASGYGMGGPAYNPYGPMMQGTLVFPHQPFTRSPRDYFMLDLNK